MMDRNINNNPSGKPFCCVIGCNEDATLNIQNLTDFPTQSCGAHVLEFLETGGYVSPIDAPIAEREKRLVEAARDVLRVRNDQLDAGAWTRLRAALEAYKEDLDGH